MDDPVTTNPEPYHVIFENERVRVLEYKDRPGDRTTPHDHPDSVMYTLSSFRRRLYGGDEQRDVSISASTAAWLLPSATLVTIGDTPTHVIFVELREHADGQIPSAEIGPTDV